MKRGILCIVLTTAVIFGMWFNSPKYKYQNRPAVETVSAQTKNIYDSVIARGSVEEGNVQKIRLPQSSKIDEVYVSVGDEVVKDSILFEVSESEDSLADTENVISEIANEDILDVFSKVVSEEDYSEVISDFYMPGEEVLAQEFTPEITAPFSGVITDIFVEKGDVALYQSALATISDFDELEICIDVPELYIDQIKVGQNAEITGEAFSGKKYIGKVREISPTAKQKNSITGTGETSVSVMLSVENKNHKLRPGYSVSAKIYTDHKNDAVVLPYSCVWQDESEHEFVYVVRDEIIHKTAVRTGFELDDVIEITSGIKEGDRVVLSPDDTLMDGMAVRLLEGK